MHVQKLNTLRLSGQEDQPQDAEQPRLCPLDFEQSYPEQIRNKAASSQESKWNVFLPAPVEEDSCDEEDPVQMALRAGSRPRAKKAASRPRKRPLQEEKGSPEVPKRVNLHTKMEYDSNLMRLEVAEKPVKANFSKAAAPYPEKPMVPSKWGAFLAPKPTEEEIKCEPNFVESKWGKLVEKPQPPKSGLENRALGFVLDESVGDDELDALLTL